MADQPNARWDSGEVPRIDRPILEDLRDRLWAASQFESVAIELIEGQTHLKAVVDPALNPAGVERRFLDVRWYTNDDFRVHYQEDLEEETWRQRWDRHPSTHNSREHFHPPPMPRRPVKTNPGPVIIGT